MPPPLLYRRLGCLGAGLLLPAQAPAQESLAALPGSPLDGRELDKVRGGFAGGQRLAFSMERQIYVNGNLESSTVLYSFGPQFSPGISPSDFSTVL